MSSPEEEMDNTGMHKEASSIISTVTQLLYKQLRLSLP
jgi:hypothetical protein